MLLKFIIFSDRAMHYKKYIFENKIFSHLATGMKAQNEQFTELDMNLK